VQLGPQKAASGAPVGLQIQPGVAVGLDSVATIYWATRSQEQRLSGAIALKLDGPADELPAAALPLSRHFHKYGNVFC
jgi:hypothetical protein